jgi:predicted RNA-binding protein Jag
MTEPTVTPAPSADAEQKRERAREVIAEILRLMELGASLEVKDAADGGISVAVKFDGEVAGVQAGKRSHLIDSLQFIANKLVNRAGTEKRWISIGVGEHPAPRVPAPKPQRPAQAPVAAKPATAAALPAAAPARPTRPAPVAAADETTLEVSEDAELAAVARSLAEKSVKFGRYFALTPMKAEDRARVYRAARAVEGLRVSLEGEGRNRRVVFTPDKPTPMPRRTLPVEMDDDEDELEA